MTGLGVLAASDNQDVAARFIDFMLSADAQVFYSDETFEYPLAIGAEGVDDPS